jgi:cell division protein FtsX
LSVQYFSKDDALKNLQKRLPNMVNNFDAYGIENPLPITLYVTFADQQQYEFVNQKKQDYQDILLSSAGGNSQDAQFSRNAHIINLLHVLQFFFVFIIASCVVVILLFLSMIIKTKFTAMNETIQVQKLL